MILAIKESFIQLGPGDTVLKKIFKVKVHVIGSQFMARQLNPDTLIL